MRLRIHETGTLDLETVKEMLWKADHQANFHPDSRWLDSYKFGNTQASARSKSRVYVEFFVRWIGREPVVMWLCSNQIKFEVQSYDILPEEAEALDQTKYDMDMSQPEHIN